ncbi:hypothetical protein VIN30_09810 [Adlercreutzia sp. R7]|uniref:Uncharacterized protein n=1 Tax=Adlercreutzia wanghongyangiae TaxID=3111451 RepID=A0ABU6IK22_9ACTN|nr:hypothetical protein [Adlercreutzia sp. R7]
MEVARRRSLRALALIGIALAVLAAWRPVESALAGREYAAASFSGVSVAESAWEQVCRSSEGQEAAVPLPVPGEGTVLAEAPPWFSDEVFSLEGFEDVRANENWTVMGFSFAGSVDEALAWGRCQLEAGGWTVVESGVAGAFTAVKEGGRLSWLLLSGTGVGERTCVVVQAPIA